MQNYVKPKLGQFPSKHVRFTAHISNESHAALTVICSDLGICGSDAVSLALQFSIASNKSFLRFVKKHYLIENISKLRNMKGCGEFGGDPDQEI